MNTQNAKTKYLAEIYRKFPIVTTVILVLASLGTVVMGAQATWDILFGNDAQEAYIVELEEKLERCRGLR